MCVCACVYVCVCVRVAYSSLLRHSIATKKFVIFVLWPMFQNFLLPLSSKQSKVFVTAILCSLVKREQVRQEPTREKHLSGAPL